MSRIILNSHVIGETVTISVDFISKIPSGQTLSTATTTIAVWAGTDANPAGVLSGGTTVSGTTANQNVTNGVSGVIYQLTFTGVTSASLSLIIQTFLIFESNLK